MSRVSHAAVTKQQLCSASASSLPSDTSEISTGLDAFNDDGRERAVQKPKMEIVLRKSESFDQAITQQIRPSAASASTPVPVVT